MRKTIGELKKLNTKNLLAYYKAERKRYYSFVSSITCSCCYQMNWELKQTPQTKQQQEEYEDWVLYLCKIKSELNTREHVTK